MYAQVIMSYSWITYLTFTVTFYIDNQELKGQHFNEIARNYTGIYVYNILFLSMCLFFIC